jgi:ubiquinone/menaquinone biosynthesis C-methylase UbiE
MTTNPIDRLALRVAYGASQFPRMAWYMGHGVAMRQLAKATQRQGNVQAPTRPRPRTSNKVPQRGRLYADMASLLRQDMANVEAGIYPLPIDRDGSLPELLDRSRLFFRDLPDIHRRREQGLHSEVLTEQTAARRPRYYLQNFHFQSGGWMTEDSARRYDTQVEVFFKGTASAMRRQALPPLHEAFAGRDKRGLRLLDAGAGTGRFIETLKQAWPLLPVTGLDLSEPYGREARHHLARRSAVDIVVAKAEAIPAADASQDAVTSIFVFHELPPRIRRDALAEFARVLKPGGRLVLVDSLQRGDEPDYDGMLDLFPQNYHEPYFSTYIQEDFPTLARACGLAHVRDVKAFVSKVMVFDKVA